jgi:hypothetical protein
MKNFIAWLLIIVLGWISINMLPEVVFRLTGWPSDFKVDQSLGLALLVMAFAPVALCGMIMSWAMPKSLPKYLLMVASILSAICIVVLSFY